MGLFLIDVFKTQHLFWQIFSNQDWQYKNADFPDIIHPDIFDLCFFENKLGGYEFGGPVSQPRNLHLLALFILDLLNFPLGCISPWLSFVGQHLEEDFIGKYDSTVGIFWEKR